MGSQEGGSGGGGIILGRRPKFTCDCQDLFNSLLVAVSNLGQGYWECRQVGGTHTRGLRQKSIALYLIRVLAWFLLSEVKAIKMRQMKFEWGQSMDCVTNRVICSSNAAQFLCCALAQIST